MNRNDTRSPQGESAIFIDGVTKSYGEVRALEDVSVEIKHGEFVSLLGPSGSGKTTLLNLIAGSININQGRIFLNGKDAGMVPANKRELGMVFQNYALMPHMSIFENVAFPLRIRGCKGKQLADKVDKALEMVRLEHVRSRKPRELSGGQQQRVSIARCMVYEPKIILMDEPLGALDKNLREEMQLEIKRLHKELNVTMVYVTHDQDEALTLSDRIVLMQNGRIVQVGSPRSLYFEPNSVFSAQFIGSSNIIEGIVEETNGNALIRSDVGLINLTTSDFPARGGDNVCVLIRPENSRLKTKPVENMQYVKVYLDDTVVLGGVVRHYVRTQHGTRLISQELNRPDRIQYRASEPLHFCWQPEHTRVLPAARM